MDDIELINQIRKGNSHAFVFLVERYQKLVLHIVVRIIKREEDIEDICQEIFIKVHQNLGKFRGDAKLSTWIATIAYRIGLNHVRKAEYKLMQPMPEELSPLSASSALSPEKLTENAELKQIIMDEVEKLPLHYRTVITLHYLEEFSYAEIEEITGMNQGTVRSYISRARVLLKEKLTFVLKN